MSKEPTNHFVFTAKAKSEVVLPTVHPNGTSEEALLCQRTDYRAALADALKRLQEAVPHPRDFLDATSRYEKAMEIFQSRRALLEALIKDITIELEAFVS